MSKSAKVEADISAAVLAGINPDEKSAVQVREEFLSQINSFAQDLSANAPNVSIVLNINLHASLPAFGETTTIRTKRAK